jgi:hypothetical protein
MAKRLSQDIKNKASHSRKTKKRLAIKAAAWDARKDKNRK